MVRRLVAEAAVDRRIEDGPGLRTDIGRNDKAELIGASPVSRGEAAQNKLTGQASGNGCEQENDRLDGMTIAKRSGGDVVNQWKEQRVRREWDSKRVTTPKQNEIGRASCRER